MLKQVMLGSGGIMLAAAIFASSVDTGSAPAEDPAQPGAPLIAPAPPTMSAPGSPVPDVPPPPFVDQPTGDSHFGSPMLSAQPVDEATAEPLQIAVDPERERTERDR
ncbi:hypothetical protein C7451_110145 [Blastomonas natatoria]|uniref:Uncharacterized protein n=1 Tax=Blastomonas natatoria TaxID=34015 RepID=A0A2V3UXL2_9SPHN|nr:hypothetical protein [Blastomonas natatoria]PXW73418.1 hypothetical protein C7451_110145 [Blastomonas natatoria]